jgi:hypothetical protein
VVTPVDRWHGSPPTWSCARTYPAGSNIVRRTLKAMSGARRNAGPFYPARQRGGWQCVNGDQSPPKNQSPSGLRSCVMLEPTRRAARRGHGGRHVGRAVVRSPHHAWGEMEMEPTAIRFGRSYQGWCGRPWTTGRCIQTLNCLRVSVSVFGGRKKNHDAGIVRLCWRPPGGPTHFEYPSVLFLCFFFFPFC